MRGFEEERALALASVAALPGWEDRRLDAEPALPVLASPSWRGVDGAPVGPQAVRVHRDA